MKPDDSKKFKISKKTYLTALLSAVALILLFFFIQRDYFSKTLDVLQPILIGIVIAYLLNPLVKLLEKFFNKIFSKPIKKAKIRHNLSRGLGIGVSLLALLAVVSAIVSLLIPEIMESVAGLIADFPSMMSSATEFFNSLDLPNRFGKFSEWYSETFGSSETQFDLNAVISGVFSAVKDGIFKYIGTLGNGLVAAFSTLFNIIIGLIVTVYALICKDTIFAQLKKVLYAFCAQSKADILIETCRESNSIMTRYILSRLIGASIVGILCFILMSVFKIPYALIISVIIAVTDIIPFFGPYIGAIPSTLLILLTDPIKALYFVILIIIIQQIEGNIISPKIIGDNVGVSPFWVLFATIIGGGLFGFPGMLIGVPVFAIIFNIIRALSNKRLAEKNMPVSTESYETEGAVNIVASDSIDSQ